MLLINCGTILCVQKSVVYLNTYGEYTIKMGHVFTDIQFLYLEGAGLGSALVPPPARRVLRGGAYIRHLYTVCPGSSDPFYMVSYYIKWVTTSWTHSNILTAAKKRDISEQKLLYYRYFKTVICILI